MVAAKRKRGAATAAAAIKQEEQLPVHATIPPANDPITNPDASKDILDDPTALRASPDAEESTETLTTSKVNGRVRRATKQAPLKEESDLSSLDDEEPETPSAKKPKRTPTKSSVAAKKGSDEIKAFVAQQKAAKAKEGDEVDPEADGDVAEDGDAVKLEARRPPPVNSDYLPLPWRGRLGYACLNTYLRFSTPPVFSSRTCRIQSILDHRHPLTHPDQPEHPTKNRPDKNQPADVSRGQRYVEEIGLANARDIAKMVRWNDRYGIKFLRLSSEMFPFASHDEYGYKLTPFASEALAEAGRVAGELGHRLTTHPGQFTQLGSPRQQVIDNAFRDLEYHDEMLSLLRLPEQADRDAVMILHLGGVFGDKQATLQRFRDNYAKLSPSVKRRLVLENDDVSWSVHELLPLCEELDIPLVLDFHHHNIIFDADQIREGTHDIRELFPRILATWQRKRITPKMHYSEPTPQAITGRQRRKHNPRPATLPPCPPDTDLMIEAKDKEQAVLELMRTFRLPGWNLFNNIVPYERDDDNKPEPRKAKKKKTKKQLKAEEEDPSLKSEEEPEPELVPEEEVGMGGPERRVYWPPGMEEWLRPKKREVKPRKSQEEIDAEALAHPTPMNLQLRKEAKARRKAKEEQTTADDDSEELPETPSKAKRTPRSSAKKAASYAESD